MRFPFFEIGQERRGKARDTVGRIGGGTTIRHEPKGRVEVVIGLPHLSGEGGSSVPLRFQDEFDHIRDFGEFGLFGVRVPFGAIAFGQLLGGDLLQPLARLTGTVDLASKPRDDRRGRRGGLMLVGMACRYLEHVLSDDVPHIGRDDHSNEPAMALLGEIGVARPDHTIHMGVGQSLVNSLGKIVV